MGKTSLAINIAYYNLQNAQNKTCIFSLEMNKTQILHKLISIGSKIPIIQIIRGKINKHEWNKIQNICKQLLESELYINDTSNISVEKITEILEVMNNNNSYKILLIIDYLQLIQTDNLTKNSNRSEELSYITRKLKNLAQNLDIPIIILSQLNRNIDTRADKKPLLSDLRESGCVSYKLFLHMDYVNQICTISPLSYIKNRITYKKNYLFFNQNTNKFIWRCNFLVKKSFFLEEIFIHRLCCRKKIIVSNLHPILIHSNWSKEHNLEQNTIITTLKQRFYNKIQILEKDLNTSILILNKDLVYEINRQEYFTFFCLSTILHNSIEQDADIVIMLASEDSTVQKTTQDKIVDLIILKNRNGSVGSAKLLFSCFCTTFKETSKK